MDLRCVCLVAFGGSGLVRFHRKKKKCSRRIYSFQYTVCGSASETTRVVAASWRSGVLHCIADYIQLWFSPGTRQPDNLRTVLPTTGGLRELHDIFWYRKRGIEWNVSGSWSDCTTYGVWPPSPFKKVRFFILFFHIWSFTNNLRIKVSQENPTLIFE